MERFSIPSVIKNSQGAERRAGFEFEVGNVAIEKAATVLHQALGGKLDKVSPYEFHIRELELGDIKIERDAKLLTSLKYREWLQDLGVDFSPGSDAERIEQEVDKLSRWLIPCEIVTSPVPFSRLDQLHELVGVLEDIGAEGTQESLYYAFGLHINPEAPSLDVDTLVAYVQGFLLMADWIIETSSTDFTRRFFTKYIDPFPGEYAELVVDNNYRPSLAQFIDDYLAHNPTRNRALDMLPIFYEVDKERLIKGLPEEQRELVKGRPAFHYRLPDCRVGAEDWNMAKEWNRWVLIEKLVENTEARQDLIEKWQQEQNSFSLSHKSNWVKTIQHFLKENEFR